MSGFDDAIGEMTSDLLDEIGSEFIYRRGQVSRQVTLRKSTLMPVLVETGGIFVEVRPVDFICLTSQLPFPDPQSGDRILGGGETFELQVMASEKVYRQINPQMTRLHAVKVG